MAKMLILKSCLWCGYRRTSPVEQWKNDVCLNGDYAKQLRSDLRIPKWCRLMDAPINAPKCPVNVPFPKQENWEKQERRGGSDEFNR